MVPGRNLVTIQLTNKCIGIIVAQKEKVMLEMEGYRVRMTPENIHFMLKQGLSFKEIASRCDVFEDAIDASLVRWLNQGRWPIEDDVVAA